jgi:hypothetical protein
VIGHCAQDGVERTDAKGLVVWDHDPVARGFMSLQDTVASNLVDLFLFPVPAQHIDKGRPAQIPRELHPSANSSLRTR